jgi:L-lactate utilization protein LutB
VPPKSQKPAAADVQAEQPVRGEQPVPVASEDVQRAGQKRQDALKGRNHTREYIDALLEERRGYVVRGLDDRIAQVDDQIRLRGGTPPND